MRVSKFFSVLYRKIIRKTIYINRSFYMRTFLKHLTKHGLRVNGLPKYIGAGVHFDGSDYSLIHIGNGVTISRDVLFLTHDLSIHTVIEGNEISEMTKSFIKQLSKIINN